MLDLERRLYDLRRQIGVSQVEMADRMGTTQTNVSRIEREDDLKLSTLDKYVAALGGRLELRAVFPDGRETITIAAPEIARA